MEYKIKADCKSYSEWSVDQETGELIYLEHEFEGYDIISYKITPKDDIDPVFESESFEEVKKELERLTNTKQN